MHLSPVALITGSARRIGAVIARTLHQAGYKIIIHYHHSQSEAQALADSLNTLRTNSAAILSADLNQFAEYAQLIHQAEKIWQRLDVLVNNASSFYPTPLGDSTEAQWDDLINTNLKAAYFLAQASAKYLKINRGCIINIADIHGERPLKNYPIYSIAKAGVIMLTKTLARELAPDIRVNAIAPGVTLLPENKHDALSVEKLRKKTLLNRFAEPEDIARAVLFLINQPAMTGQTLPIDAGRSLRQ